MLNPAIGFLLKTPFPAAPEHLSSCSRKAKFLHVFLPQIQIQCGQWGWCIFWHSFVKPPSKKTEWSRILTAKRQWAARFWPNPEYREKNKAEGKKYTFWLCCGNSAGGDAFTDAVKHYSKIQPLIGPSEYCHSSYRLFFPNQYSLFHSLLNTDFLTWKRLSYFMLSSYHWKDSVSLKIAHKNPTESCTKMPVSILEIRKSAGGTVQGQEIHTQLQAIWRQKKLKECIWCFSAANRILLPHTNLPLFHLAFSSVTSIELCYISLSQLFKA